MANWYKVSHVDEIEEDDVIQVDVDETVLCVYHVDGSFFATDGICTHEHACLTDGFVMDGVIECPLHQGRFDIRTGKALSPPVTVDLKVYPVKIENSEIWVQLGE
ncbi:MAG: ferredoxin [marine bacterium B5-7]|nr:MAG: ferredoxin [marine bacterium B5-7]